MLLQLHRSRENYEDEKPGFWEVVAYKTLWSVACWFESKLNCFPRFGHSGGQMKLRGFEPDLQVNWVWLWDSSVLICAKTANSANAESFCQLWRTEGHWPEFRILCSATVCLFNVCRCAWSFWLPDRNSEPWAISNRKQCGWPKHKHYYKQQGFNTPALHFFFPEMWYSTTPWCWWRPQRSLRWVLIRNSNLYGSEKNSVGWTPSVACSHSWHSDIGETGTRLHQKGSFHLGIKNCSFHFFQHCPKQK